MSKLVIESSFSCKAWARNSTREKITFSDFLQCFMFNHHLTLRLRFPSNVYKHIFALSYDRNPWGSNDQTTSTSTILKTQIPFPYYVSSICETKFWDLHTKISDFFTINLPQSTGSRQHQPPFFRYWLNGSTLSFDFWLPFISNYSRPIN